jgi:hypothetical protein
MIRSDIANLEVDHSLSYDSMQKILEDAAVGGMTAKLSTLQTLSAYEHGRNAAQHGKHIQACPFDTGTPDWREWRDGFKEGTLLRRKREPA